MLERSSHCRRRFFHLCTRPPLMATARVYRTPERTVGFQCVVPLRKLRWLPLPFPVLPGQRSNQAQRDRIEKDLLGKVSHGNRKHYHPTGDSSSAMPLYSGGGSLCAAEKRRWVPPLSHHGKGQRTGRNVLSRSCLQSEKAVGETGTRTAPDLCI